MKITGSLSQKGSEITLDSEECGRIAADALYRDLNRTLGSLREGVQVDPALRPYLEEELALGVERALKRLEDS